MKNGISKRKNNDELARTHKKLEHSQGGIQIETDDTAYSTTANIYQTIFESTEQAIAIVDDLAHCIEINPATCELLGYARKEMLGKSFYELIPGLKYHPEKERGDNVKSLNGIHPLRRKDGETIKLDILTTPGISLGRHMLQLRDADEMPVDLTGNQESLGLIYAMGGVKSVGAWRLNVETGAQDWTEQVYRIFEVEHDFQPTLEASISFCAPGERRAYTTAIQGAIDHGEDFELELPIITAKGNPRWVYMIGSAAQENRKTVTVMGTLQDVTGRKEAELKSSKSWNLLEDVLKHLPGMAYRCLNDESWTMLFVSAGCQKLTGYDPDDVLGNQKTSFTEIIHPQDRGMVRETIRDAIEGQGVFEITYRILTADGALKWVWE